MSNKIEIKKKSLINNDTVSMNGKSIVIMQSTQPDRNEIDYLITTDGVVSKTNNNNDNIIICMFGIDINHTQKRSLVELIQSLRKEGATTIHRYNEQNKKEVNPTFDLNSTLISYNLK